MKILLTTILCLLLSLPAFADQKTTVLQEQATLGKASVTLPYIDGSNDAAYENTIDYDFATHAIPAGICRPADHSAAGAGYHGQGQRYTALS